MIAGAGLSRVLLRALLFTGFVWVSGCSSSRGDGGGFSGVCVPLETRECKALSGCSGVQQCNADGLSFSECQCPGGDPNGSSGNAGTGNISGAGGGQSQGGAGGNDSASTGGSAGDPGWAGDAGEGGAPAGGNGGSSGAFGGSDSGGTGGVAGSGNAGSGNAGSGNAGSGNAGSGGSSGSTGTGGGGGAGAGGIGGTSGSAGNAGSAGSAGSGGAPQQIGCDKPGIIDDFEDGNDVPCIVEGRVGKWRIDHDESPGGRQSPNPFLPSADTTPGSDFLGYTKGTGFAVWGGGLSVTLRQEPGTQMKPYDASKYAGITFRARAQAPLLMSAGFQTAQTLPPIDGGLCQDTCGNAPKPGCARCYEPFRKLVELGTTWKTYHVPFAQLRQGTQMPQKFDERQLMNASFVAISSNFEFWVDDIAFYSGNPTPFGCNDPKIIEDFEDGDTRICNHDGRVGAVANSNDGLGVQTPEPFSSSVETRLGDGSDFAAHTRGSGFTQWGGGLILNLNQPLLGGVPKAYDAKKYAGFSFDAMSTSTHYLLVGFQTTQTVPTEEGGQCQQTCSDGKPLGCTECFLPFHKVVEIGPGWQRYYVSFAELIQVATTSQTFSASQLMTMVITSLDPSFDFWVDNVRFFSPGEHQIGCSSPAMIDDFEDGDAAICAHDGRRGSWVNDNDQTGTQWPLPLLPTFESEAPSQFVLETNGAGFTKWGGGVATGFNKPLGSAIFLPYDARKYQGVKLLARSSQPIELVVGFQTIQTVTAELGGECDCDPSDFSCEPCFMGFSATADADEFWNEFTVPFTSVRQPQTTSQTFEEDELLYMTIVATQPDFDFQIDDLRFY